MENAADLNHICKLLHLHRLSVTDLEAALKTEMVHLCETETRRMRLYLQETRNEIEDYFAATVDPIHLDQIPAAELKAWLWDNYPWMDAETQSIAYNNGLYFAVK